MSFDTREIYANTSEYIRESQRIPELSQSEIQAILAPGRSTTKLVRRGNGNWELLIDGVKIGYDAKIGNGAKIGDGVKIGYDAKIGDDVKIGYDAEIGNGAKIGDGFICKAILYITASRHTISYWGEDAITIGCHQHTIRLWLEHFEEIGKKEGYTDEQISEYGKIIKMIAAYHAS